MLSVQKLKNWKSLAVYNFVIDSSDKSTKTMRDLVVYFFIIFSHFFCFKLGREHYNQLFYYWNVESLLANIIQITLGRFRFWVYRWGVPQIIAQEHARSSVGKEWYQVVKNMVLKNEFRQKLFIDNAGIPADQKLATIRNNPSIMDV